MRALGVLGAVAALLAAYLLFFDHDPRERSGAATGRSALLSDFDRGARGRITIARAGETPYQFVWPADGHGWRIQPGNHPADQGAVEDLLTAFATAESERTAVVTPEAAGLVPARVTVSVEGGGHHSELRLGRPDATGRGVFVQVGVAAPVRVGPRRLLDLADRPLAAVRDRRLVSFPPDTVVHVDWVDPAGRAHAWDRRLGGGWRNSSGERLSSDRVDVALRRLGDVRGESGDGGRDGWIALRDAAGAEARLSAGDVAQEDRDEIGRALAAADAADHRLLVLPPDRVRRVELQDGGRHLVLVRDSAVAAWRFETHADGRGADSSVVDDWLARLVGVQVTAPGRAGRRLIVNGATEQAVTVVPADQTYAELDPDPLRFRSRKVLDFAHFDARQLRRISASGTVDARSADGETWTSTPSVDSAAVARIAAALGNLRAATWLPRPPGGAPGSGAGGLGPGAGRARAGPPHGEALVWLRRGNGKRRGVPGRAGCLR